MFKIISAEIKKMLSKPGIYILSILLALILVFGVFIYKPVIFESSQFVLEGDTYLTKYTDFNAGVNAGKRAEGQKKLNSIIDAVNSYTVESAGGVSQKVYMETLVNNFDENYATYQSCANEITMVMHDAIADRRGKDAILVIVCAMELGIITRLPYLAAKKEFPSIGGRSNYNKYLSDGFLDSEKEPIKQLFKKRLPQLFS